MKCAIAEEEDRIIKIELLNYMPLFDMLLSEEKEINMSKNNPEENNDESSLNEEDLKEGIENINFFNMRNSAVLEDIKPCKDNYDEEYIDALSSNNMSNTGVEEALNKAIIFESKHSKSNTATVSATANNNKSENPKIINTGESNNKVVNNQAYLDENINDIKNSKINDLKNEKENDEDLEISISEFNDRNEKVFYRIAQYLFQNKIKVSQMFENLLNNSTIKVVNSNTNSHNQKYIVETEAFFSTLEKIGISLDTIDQYCILMKLSYEDDSEGKAVDSEFQGNYIDIQMLKEEMTNYGVFDDITMESVINLDNKKFTNKFYADKSGSLGNSTNPNQYINTNKANHLEIKVEDNTDDNNNHQYLKSNNIKEEENFNSNIKNDKSDNLLEKSSLFDNLDSTLKEAEKLSNKNTKNEKLDDYNKLLDEKNKENSFNYDLDLDEIEDNNAFDEI
jgi:hypothetical protein